MQPPQIHPSFTFQHPTGCWLLRGAIRARICSCSVCFASLGSSSWRMAKICEVLSADLEGIWNEEKLYLYLLWFQQSWAAWSNMDTTWLVRVKLVTTSMVETPSWVRIDSIMGVGPIRCLNQEKWHLNAENGEILRIGTFKIGYQWTHHIGPLKYFSNNVLGSILWPTVSWTRTTRGTLFQLWFPLKNHHKNSMRTKWTAFGIKNMVSQNPRVYHGHFPYKKMNSNGHNLWYRMVSPIFKSFYGY